MTSSLPLIVSAGEALTDLITTGDHTWRSYAGGAGWNVARACARLGVPSAFAGAVGQDNFGDQIYRDSLEAGLDLRFLQRLPAPTLLAVVSSLQPVQYHFLGENSADLQFDPTRLPAGWLGAAQWLHLGGISLTRWPLADTLLGLLEAARAAGVKVSFDPNARILHHHPEYPNVFKAVARRADVIKLSEEDLAFFFAGMSEPEALAQLRALNSQCPIVITRGGAGASLYHGNAKTDLPTPQVEVVDTVGAGDALCAGLLVSAVHSPNASWEEHLHFGMKAAAASCRVAGAYAPTPAEVQGV